jgi:hypothetical protein
MGGFPISRFFRLNVDGVRCDERGLFVGGAPTLERSARPGGRESWKTRPAAALNRDLEACYGFPVDASAKQGGLTVVAEALERGDLALAQITALLLQFPDPPSLTKDDSAQGAEALAWQLIESGLLKADWDSAKHPRAGEPPNPGWFAPKDDGGIEVDETIIGKIEDAPKRVTRGEDAFRNTVLTLVERGGSARSFHVEGTTIAELKPIIAANVAKNAAFITDQATWYSEIGAMFKSHDTVNHSRDEHVRFEPDFVITTNTVEGYYSTFKRGMIAVYQHCKERHLHRYLVEFDFRYSNRVRLGVNDVDRADRALLGVKGKRLTYRTTGH